MKVSAISLRVVLAAGNALFLTACGGPSVDTARTARPFPPELELTYENGADFVTDPEMLEGQWRSDWSSELDERVRTADVIAVVIVPTLRTDIDPDGKTSYRLAAEFDETILGGEESEIELHVVEGEAGFPSVSGNEQRLQGTKMVLFLRWAPSETGIVARWHLSPAGEGVLARVRYLAERRRGVEREGQPGQVYVHQN
jgi:hypothetical protein